LGNNVIPYQIKILCILEEPVSDANFLISSPSNIEASFVISVNESEIIVEESPIDCCILERVGIFEVLEDPVNGRLISQNGSRGADASIERGSEWVRAIQSKNSSNR
jgi:hypothetical protein